MRADIQHPSSSTLALLAGGELVLGVALKTRWHVCFCRRCAGELERFRATRAELREDQAADGLNRGLGAQISSESQAWKQLEAEMRANIRLGLAAGSLADPWAAEPADTLTGGPAQPWRWAAVGAALVFVVLAGWSLRAPLGVPDGPEFSQKARLVEPVMPEAPMQLLVPVADVSRTETDFDGSTRSRVIDRETGQVTLQQVYVD